MRFTLLRCVLALAISSEAVSRPVGRGTGITIPITKRATFLNADGSVKIEAVSSHAESVKAKILRGFESFERNTGATHPAALERTQKRSTGTDSLTDYDSGVLWYGSISVGTPGSTFTVQFDTGSSDSVLPGPSCTSSDCSGHSIYDPSSSSTAQDLGETFTLTYGDGSSVSGEQYTDTIAIAGLTATEQTLGVASQYSNGFAIESFPPDGLLGMAFQSLSRFDAPPLFQNLISQGETSEPVFGFKLASTGGELFLGGVDSDLYTGDFSYVSVEREGYWEVTMDGIQVNGQTIQSDIDSVIDTGTTLIVLPPSDAASLYNTVGGTDESSTLGEGYYSFPCDSFPSFSLTFGGTTFPISADAINLGTVSSGSSDCVSGIVGTDTGASFWIIGDVFLQGVYTAFDVGNAQVGFAELA